MFGSDIIEVVIGLVFIYFIVSLLCSAITEWIARVVAMRAKTLKEGIIKLLGDEELQETVFDHPLVKGLSSNAGLGEKILGFLKHKAKDKANLAANPNDATKANTTAKIKNYDKPGPSELPSRIFSVALIDTLMSGDDISRKRFGGLNKKIEDSTEIGQETKDALKALLAAAKSKTNKWEDTIKEFRTSIEKWFDDAMDRVSGWYKRKTQVIILVSALCICLALNIDTFVIANSLYKDPTLRTSIVAAAETRIEQAVSENKTPPDVTEIQQSLQGLSLPLGWSEEPGIPNKVPSDFGGWIIKLMGILVTTLAVSLGAPFWFDLLNKIVNLRSSGKKPEKSEETAKSAT